LIQKGFKEREVFPLTTLFQESLCLGAGFCGIHPSSREERKNPPTPLDRGVNIN